jgi:4-hydroxybenzoate polyprenyltransferase
MRVHQWAKNILVFVPVLLAHKMADDSRLLAACIACVSFSLCASGGYIFNDIFDREADRQHPAKKHRPFAADTLSVSTGFVCMAVLFGGSVVVAVAWLPFPFVILLGVYGVSSMLYSALLKRLVMLDVLVLAGLYILRILAGGVAVVVPVSPWLLAFSGFLFLSLAFVKRYTELEAMSSSSPAVIRRGYVVQDKELLRNLGTSSGYLAALVFALYINNSPDTLVLYQQPQVLWGICPCLLYWISRVWFLAHRGVIHQDPMVFTLTDPVSYFVGGVIAVLILAAV